MRLSRRKRSDISTNVENDCEEIDCVQIEEMKILDSSSTSSANIDPKKKFPSNPGESKNDSPELNFQVTDFNTNISSSTNGSAGIAISENSEGFKCPLTPTQEIRRKSNRILSLKRSSQNQTSVVGSSEIDAQASGSDQSNSINDAKPNQTSDVSSTSNSTNKPSPTNQNPSSSQKTLRKVQLWTEDDIRWFFEALCEHGKDFPHIQSYIASRCEKKGIPQESIKNYEQVRHFYYRMWHKISQSLKISQEVEKGVQEIYGLINYGELWKRFGAKVEYKMNVCLQQLVDYGYTVVKMKGKSVRIRTPVCNALKKIHNIENKISKPVTQSMPKEILVELIPATDFDWLRVHSMAQNPRLRTKLTMQQRISSLIAYLEKRWNMSRVHQNAFRSLMGADLDIPCSNDKSDASSSQRSDNYHIILKPQKSVKLCDKVTLKSTANAISYHNYRSTTHGTTQIDLSLSAYMKNMFNDNLSMKKSKMRKSGNKSTSKAMNNEPPTSTQNDIKDSANKDEPKIEKTKESSENESQPIDLFKLLDSMNEELEITQNKNIQKNTYDDWKIVDTNSEINNEMIVTSDRKDEESGRLPEPPAHQTLAQWLAGGNLDNEVDDELENSKQNNEDEMDIPEEIEESKNVDDKNSNNDSSQTDDKTDNYTTKSNPNKKQRRVSAETGSSNEIFDMLTAERARQGWDYQNGKSVTIGELYLLFCQPTKIVLEYNWIKEEINEEQEQRQKIDNDEQTEIDKNPEKILKPMTIFQKFLVAANMTLMNYKKPSNQNVGNGNCQPSTSNSATLTTNRTSRKRGTAKMNNTPSTTNSQLLSDLIKETIFDDVEKSPDSKAQKSSINKSSNESPIVSKSNLPSAAPKAKSKSITVPDDPTKMEEVLKEFKIRSRQRRPLTKFMYNHHHQQNKININGIKPTVLYIRASNIAQTEGSNGKKIVLTANMTSPRDQFSNPSSVLIPVQLETHTSTVSNGGAQDSIDNPPSAYLRLLPQVPDKNDPIKNSSQVPSTEFSQTAQGSNQTSSSSQTQWLQEEMANNDISLGSLFDNCDNFNSNDVGGGSVSKIDSLNGSHMTSLSNDIETHINNFANDNSVELMAKFADLADKFA